MASSTAPTAPIHQSLVQRLWASLGSASESIEALFKLTSIVAIVASGWFASATFSQKFALEQQVAEIGLEAKIEPSLELTRLSGNAPTGFLAQGKLTLKNPGKRPATVSIPGDSLVLYKVCWAQSREKGSTCERWNSQNLTGDQWETWIPERRILLKTGHNHDSIEAGTVGSMFVPGESGNTHTFALAIKEPGLYVVAFSAPIDAKSAEWRKKFDVGSGPLKVSNSKWETHAYLELK